MLFTIFNDFGVAEHLSSSHLVHYNNSSAERRGYLDDDLRQLVKYKV